MLHTSVLGCFRIGARSPRRLATAAAKAFASAFPAMALLIGRPALVLLCGAILCRLRLGVAHTVVARPTILFAKFRDFGAFLLSHYVMLLSGHRSMLATCHHLPAELQAERVSIGSAGRLLSRSQGSERTTCVEPDEGFELPGQRSFRIVARELGLWSVDDTDVALQPWLG